MDLKVVLVVVCLFALAIPCTEGKDPANFTNARLKTKIYLFISHVHAFQFKFYFYI